MLLNYSLSKLTIIGATMLAITTTLPCPTAEAQVKAFKISGAGEGPQGLPLPLQEAREQWVVGTATHLGMHSGEGTVKTDSATPHFDENGVPTHFTGEFGSGDGGFTFTAANGDKLGCHYGRADADNGVVEVPAAEPGKFVLTILELIPSGDLDNPFFFRVEALFIAEFVPQPSLCTGRFAGVKGSWVMYAHSEPFILGSSAPVAYSWEGEGKLNFAKGKK